MTSILTKRGNSNPETDTHTEGRPYEDTHGEGHVKTEYWGDASTSQVATRS